MTNIGDDFTDQYGTFTSYATYDATQNTQLQLQRHVDLRSFESANLLADPTMLSFDLQSMGTLDGQTMSALDASPNVVRYGEAWTAGTVAKQSDRNNWRGISLTCAAGTNSTQSVLQESQLIGSSGGIRSIDISGFENTSSISLALPAFPLASVTLAQTFIDITSAPDGNPATGPTDSIAFSQSTTTLIAGDSEARFPLSLLTQVDRTNITGIRLRIQATGACTFRCLAIRVLAGTWEYAPIDYDTLYDRMVHPVSRTGSLTESIVFPQTSVPRLPNFWPILFWSNSPSGPGDPKPIDSKIGCWFNTGSMTGSDSTHKNQVSLYFRERREDQQTQLDLNAQSQAYLDSLRHQPDYGDIGFAGRTQADLDGLPQYNLDGDTQFSLERVADPLAAAWIEARLTWYTGAVGLLTIADADQEGVNFSGINLLANTNYLFEIELEDSGIRALIYQLDGLGNVGTLVYDSLLIEDESLILRRRGRAGWYAEFHDYDAYLESIQPRALAFGEYRSHPFRSYTPVDGASLHAQATPDTELVTTILPAIWGGTVSSDASKSNSGKAYKILSTGGIPLQGIHTNKFLMDDWDETEITFDLLFPSSALTNGKGVEAFLIGPNFVLVPLTLPILVPDQWQSIRIFPGAGQFLIGGLYELVIVQTSAHTDTTWYVDNVSVTRRSIKWQGRPDAPDPWDIIPIPWVDFKDTVNHPNGGVAFGIRGSGLQIRGQARTQDAEIYSIKAIPRYASQGNFVWSSSSEAVSNTPTILPGLEMLIAVSPTVASLSTTIGSETVTQQRVAVETSLTFSVTGLDSTHLPSGVTVVSYLWDFGDGTTSTLASPTHTYNRADIQTQVTLIVVDNYGRIHSARKQIYVTGLFARPTTDIVTGFDVDSRRFVGSRSISESLTISSSATAQRGIARSVADSSTFGESLTRLRVVPVSLNDSALGADAISYVKTPPLSSTKFAGTGADDASIGTSTWNNPGNITAADSVVTTAGFPGIGAISHYLRASNFGFAIPGTATIKGISVDIWRTCGGVVHDNAVKLVKGGVISGNDKSTATNWNGQGLVTYGSQGDLWGLTLTPTDVNDSTFGFALSGVAGNLNTANVDYIKITVYYQP